MFDISLPPLARSTSFKGLAGANVYLMGIQNVCTENTCKIGVVNYKKATWRERKKEDSTTSIHIKVTYKEMIMIQL